MVKTLTLLGQSPWLIPWVLVMISLPLIDRYAGPTALLRTIELAVGLQLLTVLLILHRTWHWRRLLATTAAVTCLAWLLEWVGSRSGIPFGSYTYTDRLQPQLGHVPLLIPAAWMMMLPPAWAVAARITAGRPRALFALVSGLAFMAWDLFLDPQMVMWQLWIWAEPGGYFGIPWVNFGGWFLGAAAITTLVQPPPVPNSLLLLVYGLTWGLETIGLLFFWGLPGPALVGGLGMGAMLAWALVTPPPPLTSESRTP